MATVLATILHVAQMGAPRTDRAFDRKSEGWEKLATRYVRTRHPSDLAALPRREGKAPTLYALSMLSPEGYQGMQAERGAGRIYFLVRLCVGDVRHASGQVEKPSAFEKVGGLTLATMAWVEKLQALGGLGLCEELGNIIERRAVIGDLDPEEGDEVTDPLDRYALPPGVALGL